jgi:transposase
MEQVRGTEKKRLDSRQGEGGGRPPKVDGDGWHRFRSELESETQKHYTSHELHDRFSSAGFGTQYSMGHFCRLLREKLGMYYYKPSPRDYRRPEDALFKLTERLRGTIDALKFKGIDPSRIAIGFSDEVAVQHLANNARFWCLEPHLPRTVNSEPKSQKFFGFYALLGESVLVPLEKCDAQHIKGALEEVRKANSAYDALIMIWDNAKTHKSVDDHALKANIHAVFLPPYSPDLNPIERVWKTCKRKVNQMAYFKALEALASAFEQAYESVKVQASFAEGWIEKMQSIISWIYPMKTQENVI